jgi:iron complex transport system ATP-binding protein
VEQILSLRSVGFRYDGQWTLKGIDLDIHKGELLGILGPNGSGKSTLLRLLDGLLVPQEGEVRFRDRPIAGRKRKGLAKEVAFVAQENAFRFSFSVLEVVLMGRAPHLSRLQFEGKKDIDTALHSLETMNALDLAERSIHELSGGEKQRILIARALAQEPQLLLLDEPTSFLDIKFKREIFELLSWLNKRDGLTIVVVSHDIDLAAHYCQRLIMLKDGYLFTTGTPEAAITAENVESVYDCPVLIDRNPATGSPRVNIVGKTRSGREG